MTPPVAPQAPAHPAHEPSKPRPPRDSMVAIPIPIFGGENGLIYLPSKMTKNQWKNVIKMTELILNNYLNTMGEEGGEDSAEEEEDS